MGIRRFLLAALAVSSVSCLDPTHDDAVDALGPEVGGVPEGPRHRPGQPCLVCHGEVGPGPQFVAAGTVYDYLNSADPGAFKPVAGVVVRLTDANGAKFSLVTNEVGSFYARLDAWTPTYPVFVDLELNGWIKPMKTRVGRDIDCNKCHRSPSSVDQSHSYPVYVKEIAKDGTL